MTGSRPQAQVAKEMDETSHKEYEPRPQSVVSLYSIICYARYDASNHRRHQRVGNCLHLSEGRVLELWPDNVKPSL